MYLLMKKEMMLGSGPTLSVLELVSIVATQSPAILCEEEGEDSAVYRELQELLDEPTSSGSKETLDAPSNGSRSRIGDQRSYTYDEVIVCQEKLYDSDDFQFSIDDVRKICTEWKYFIKYYLYYHLCVGILLLWRKVIVC